MFTRRWAANSVAFLLLLLLGCRRSAQAPAWKETCLSLADPLPAFDVYFTWEDYAPNGPTTNVRYLWNGTNLGRGTVGGEEAVQRFKTLPEGSRVLIYPSYYLEWQRERSGYMYPRFQWHSTIVEIAQSRDLKLIFSPRDHNGHLHPQCVPPKEQND